jgi:hypothetical protein
MTSWDKETHDTISEAITNITINRDYTFVILIKEGTYNEAVYIGQNKSNLILLYLQVYMITLEIRHLDLLMENLFWFVRFYIILNVYFNFIIIGYSFFLFLLFPSPSFDQFFS